MDVTSDSEYYSTHQGQTWYFCSKHCRERFDADPQDALEGLHKANSQSSPNNIYTCPMHPEVHQQGPGNRPDCGMALKPETPQISRVEDTCPMHPEVVQDGPGGCPKCGMALEPCTVPADTGPSGELIDMTRRFWVGRHYPSRY